MGGYGITEDCPGFLANKWMDAQLEATYEGPEAVQRRQLTLTMTSEFFLAQFRAVDRRDAADCSDRRDRGLHGGHGDEDVAVDARLICRKPPIRREQAVSRAAAGRDLCAGRCAVLAGGLALPDSGCAGAGGARRGRSRWRPRDWPERCSSSPTCAMCRRRGRRARFRASAPSWFGYNRHPAWDEEGGRMLPDSELDELEETMPGISRLAIDVVGADGGHQ